MYFRSLARTVVGRVGLQRVDGTVRVVGRDAGGHFDVAQGIPENVWLRKKDLRVFAHEPRQIMGLELRRHFFLPLPTAPHCFPLQLNFCHQNVGQDLFLNIEMQNLDFC